MPSWRCAELKKGTGTTLALPLPLPLWKHTNEGKYLSLKGTSAWKGLQAIYSAWNDMRGWSRRYTEGIRTRDLRVLRLPISRREISPDREFKVLAQLIASCCPFSLTTAQHNAIVKMLASLYFTPDISFETNSRK
jgi:hypothetical protein